MSRFDVPVWDGAHHYLVCDVEAETREDAEFVVLASIEGSKQVERCEAYARRGTGYGTCDKVLDSQGQCDYARNHADEEGAR